MENKYLLQITTLVLFTGQIFEINAQAPPGGILGRLLTEDEGCGIPKVKASVFRIVGGKAAPRGGFPWMALLGYQNSIGQIAWRCGGSLITSRHVLTAAHCLRPSLIKVRLGEHNTDSDEDDDTVQNIGILRTKMHPDHNKRDGTNDIAILYLQHDAEFSNHVRPICIPTNEPFRSRSFVGEKPFIAGWGRLQEGGKTSIVLQQLELPVLENSECKERYKKQRKFISDNQFGGSVLCAGDLNGGRDSCQGDSGGPMMYPVEISGDRYRFYQIGLVSYGIGCARTDTPGVYCKVQNFVDWIQDIIEDS
ncbi:venom protease-like [Sitodiplosis mosellana]|uniref:venom protease-like n=1 Tax=Sitodiplosis mosellana TaxID=263140 RepID=UPI002444CA2E|nr:venom protease-like [Sitodiplosis mosellana]XP_055308153.1 venom protease-like [Sitodiplosis mosellana]